MENIERKIIELIATDRIDIPISSMSGKLKRAKPKLGKAVYEQIEDDFAGERVYARVESGDQLKARTMSQAIALFAQNYPRHGQILHGYIEELRDEKEVHLYFGTNPGCKLTADDYLGVMSSIGFSEGLARDLYPELMEASRRISKKRDEERSVMVGG